MATFRGQHSQLLAPGLGEILLDWLREHAEEFSQFCSVRTSDRQYEQDQIYASFGRAKLKPEGEQISYDDPIQGGTKRYIHDTYALAWQITEEMLDDDQYDKMRQMPAQLMKSMRHQMEHVGASPLNLGFTTMLTADGVSLFNTAHPLLEPSSGDITNATWSNRLSTPAAPSVTALQTLLLLAEDTVDERGLRMHLSPRYAWFHPSKQFDFQRILGSQFDPDNAGSNAINTVQGRVEPRALHYLTSNNAWYISCGEETNYVKFYHRRRPTTDNTDDFETKSSKYSIHARFSAGATDARGWWGTEGA